MRIINKTQYPSQEVRKLVRLGCRGLDGLNRVTVTVLPSRKYVTGWADEWARTILIRVPDPDAYPLKGWKRHRNGVWNHDPKNWQEAVVALAAHEGRHHDNWFHRIKFKSSQRMEMNCEAWEHKVLKDYRAAQEGVLD